MPLIYLLNQCLRRLVEVLHEVVEDEEQPGEVQQLRVPHGRADNRRHSHQGAGHAQQHSLLLHQLQHMEQEQQQLRMLHVKVCGTERE